MNTSIGGDLLPPPSEELLDLLKLSVVLVV